MAGLAMFLFLGLFFFGADTLGWTDSHGRVQMALASSFVFGIIFGLKNRG